MASQRGCRPHFCAGINKKIGWHTFRDTFSTLIKSLGVDRKGCSGTLAACILQDHDGRLHAGFGSSETPGTGSGRSRVHALLPPCHECLRNMLVHDNRLARRFRLAVPNYLVHHDRTLLMRRSKQSRSHHCRPISSLLRIPVKASQTIIAPSRSSSSSNNR